MMDSSAAGVDVISRDAGEDLVLAGALGEVCFEDDKPGLDQFWNQWLSSDPIATCVAYLDGSLTGGLVEPQYAIDPGYNILDDANVDRVLGEGDAEWLLHDVGEDINDFTVGVDAQLDIG